MIQFKRLQSNAIVPERKSEGAAGFDLHSTSDLKLRAGEYEVIGTGIACAIPRGTVGLIRPRSGLAVKHGIDVLAGVIDSDYRGELKVVLVNHGGLNVSIEEGDRVAQLVVVPYIADSVHTDILPDTARGDSGFGSTGS